MGIVILLILFFVWAFGTIRTESKNIDYYHSIGDSEREQRSAEHGANAIFCLGLFALLALAALIMP
ncbi:MAG: hypothetical protein IJE27_06630 [Anaerotignum sp.]|nr:hypothetical protein [Anaerotignum sp.]